MTRGHALFAPGGVAVDGGKADASSSPLSVMKLNATEQSTRPAIIMGMDRRRMRRRPMRSMEWNATRVKAKFVVAMEREVRVGERKPRRRKMVAEKYIREF